ncbi:MAG TPA: diguanylate cyclase, partial [Gemmatimonas sp.]|nr:diguanylate cyclase [Gemmatimonas sp.]
MPPSPYAQKGKMALMAGLVAFTVLVTVWLFVGAPGGAPGVMRAALPGCIAAIAAVLAFMAAELPSLDPGTRRFWRVFGVAQLIPLGVTYVAIIVPSVAPSGESTIFVNSVPGITQLILLYAMLQLPSAPRVGVKRVKLWLDLSTVFVGGMLVVWYNMYAFTEYASASLVVPFAMRHLESIGDVVLLVVLAMLWRRTLLRHRSTVVVLLGAGLLVHLGGQVASTIDMLSGHVSLRWTMLATPAASLLFAIAAWYEAEFSMHRELRGDRISPRGALTISLLTYAAVLPGFALLIKAAQEEGAQPLGGLVLGAVALTGLAFARQVTSARETVRKQTESTLRNNEARFRALVQHSSDVITIIDAEGTIIYASPSMWTVLGHDPQHLVGTKLITLLHDEDVEFAANFLSDLARSTPLRGASTPGALKREWRIAHANGSWRTVDNVGTNLLIEPMIEGLVLNTRDVTEQSVIKQQYMHQAFHDSLTDLANRSLFLYQVGHALNRASRAGDPVTVLFVDLDNFKTVNDSLGHAAGDKLLVEAARRLANCVRDSDLIARLGGDEFAVLVEQAGSTEEVLEIAERIEVAVACPFQLEGKEVFISASIGIARTNGGENSDELVRNADVAMYVAKTRGKGQHVLFEPQMHTAALERLVVEADLRRAIDQEEFMLEYQAIVLLTTGEIVGAEALVRWCCRDRGTVAPGVFIPIAEETGLIVPIGRWVLKRACRAAQDWETERGLPMRITVNLSGRQLQEPGIIDDVRTALQESGLKPSRLVLEITESMLM